MSGGIFPNRPFQFNLKCIVFTIIIAGGYWFLPPKNWIVLIFLLWLPYVSLAWYDYTYDCRDKIMPTAFPLGRYIFLPFKPQGYKDEYKKLTPEQLRFMDMIDHITLWGLFIIVLTAGGYFIFRKNGRK